MALGFTLDESTQAEIIRGKAFVQLKNGPFDLDLVFAPDGIEDYQQAKARAKDKLDLHLLELFRLEYESKK